MKAKISEDLFKFSETLRCGYSVNYRYEILSRSTPTNWLTYLFTGKKTEVKYCVKRIEKYQKKKPANPLNIPYSEYEDVSLLYWTPEAAFMVEFDSKDIIWFDNLSELEQLITKAKIKEHDGGEVVFSSDDILI